MVMVHQRLIALGVVALDPHDRRTQIVGPMLLGHTSEWPETGFQSFGQRLEAFGKAQAVGYRLDEPTRAMVRAITDHEDRSTESDTLRWLIRRAYRALPPEAQTVDTATRRDEPGA